MWYTKEFYLLLLYIEICLQSLRSFYLSNVICFLWKHSSDNCCSQSMCAKYLCCFSKWVVNHLCCCFPGPNHMPMQGPGPGPNQPPNMPSGSMNMPPSSHGSMGGYNHTVPSSQGMPAQSQMNMTQGQPMGNYGPRPNMNMQPNQGKTTLLLVSTRLCCLSSALSPATHHVLASW